MNTFTDTDLVVLEDLDFATPCQFVEEECDGTARWYVEAASTCCGRRRNSALCDRHKEIVVRWFSEPTPPGNYYCASCDATVYGLTNGDFWTITKVEAL